MSEDPVVLVPAVGSVVTTRTGARCAPLTAL